MKKFLLLLLLLIPFALFGMACKNDSKQKSYYTIPGTYIVTIEFEYKGHDMIIFRDGMHSSITAVHSPECRKCAGKLK